MPTRAHIIGAPAPTEKTILLHDIARSFARGYDQRYFAHADARRAVVYLSASETISDECIAVVGRLERRWAGNDALCALVLSLVPLAPHSISYGANIVSCSGR